MQLEGETGTAMSQPEEDPSHLGDNLTSLVQQGDNAVNFGTISPALFAAIFQQAMNPQDGQPSSINARGAWTQQEDELLRSAVQQLGPKKWSDIARLVPSRSSKQCRERWFDRLAPDLKHGPFEHWEDQVIIEKQKEVGNRWSVIARLLPGRSSGSVKNRWYSALKSNSNDYSMSVDSMMSNTGIHDSSLMEQNDVTGNQQNDEL